MLPILYCLKKLLQPIPISSGKKFEAFPLIYRNPFLHPIEQELFSVLERFCRTPVLTLFSKTPSIIT